MNLTFVFWFAAFYTFLLFGLQFFEFIAGRSPFQFAVVNAIYLALLSAYVGSKEARRWDKQTPPLPEVESSWRLPGEWFVGLWLVTLPAAALAVQIWPSRFHYPNGLTTITLEVLGFYLSTNVSRWLKDRETQTQTHLENRLAQSSAETTPLSPAMDRRVSKKRQRYITAILEVARKKGSVTRLDVQQLTGLKASAAGGLLTAMVDQGTLQRTGKPGDVETIYQSNGTRGDAVSSRFS